MSTSPASDVRALLVRQLAAALADAWKARHGKRDDDDDRVVGDGHEPARAGSAGSTLEVGS